MYLLYLAAIAVFFATPPDTSQLLIISNSIQHGLKKSCFTIVGDLTANILQMTAAAFGLAAIIATSAQAFLVIKYFGVAYLAWIGLKLFLSKGNQDQADESLSSSATTLFHQGFITSSTNPYAVIFFAALFPQFINPSASTLPQLLILGSTYIVVDGILLLFWGWLAIRTANRMKNFSSTLINKICGVLMISAAALLASKDLQPQSK